MYYMDFLKLKLHLKKSSEEIIFIDLREKHHSVASCLDPTGY